MSSYLRPSIDAPVLHDADGKVIDYGNRWGGSPPEETYSVDTHPERFAPLHTVADALIAYPCDTYDVQLIEGDATAADLLHPAPEVIRAVRIRAERPGVRGADVRVQRRAGRAGIQDHQGHHE